MVLIWGTDNDSPSPPWLHDIRAAQAREWRLSTIIGYRFVVEVARVAAPGRPNYLRGMRKSIDPALTPARLTAIATKALGREAKAVSFRVLHGGCLNRVVAIEIEGEPRGLVLKVSPRPVPGEVEREAEVLRYFARATRLRVPRPLLVDTSCALLPGPYLVMERLPGVVLHDVWDTLPREHRRGLAEEIARDITELHEQRVTGFGGVELPPEQRRGSWPEVWIPRYRDVLAEARRLAHLPTAVLDRAEEIMTWFPSLLDIGSTSTLTHYDIWSGNILVQAGPDGARVTGYLDLPGYWADRAREISFMELFGLTEVTTSPIYRARHRPDDTFDLRKHAYNLKMNLRHVSMYPGEVRYRDGVLDCLVALERAQ